MTDASVATLMTRFPDVLLDHDNHRYYAGLLTQQLLLNRCEACAWWHAEPLRSMCPACWSSDVRATPVTGRGVIHLLTRLHQGPAVEGVSYDPPLLLAAIELDEQPGLRVVGTVLPAADAPVEIGQRVELVWPSNLVAPRLAFRAVAP